MKTRICKTCKVDKIITDFRHKQKKSGKISISHECKKCVYETGKARQQKYYQDNKEHIQAYLRGYYRENKGEILEKSKNYYHDHKEDRLEYVKEYYQENREEKLQYAKEYIQDNKDEVRVKKREYKQKRRSDPEFNLRERVSTSIRAALRLVGASKNGKSCLEFLPYTIQELREHLEHLFEPWMNWKNWGVYRPDIWSDTDPTTWTWQIDHIVPHSRFKYTSMEDQAFKDCWALSNLRPYSAKQNIIDGDR